MRKTLIIAVSFLLVTNGYSQNEDSMMIKKISDEILTNGKAYDNLHYLTKQIGGRCQAQPNGKSREMGCSANERKRRLIKHGCRSAAYHIG
jgi:hypothetical protein